MTQFTPIGIGATEGGELLLQDELSDGQWRALKVGTDTVLLHNEGIADQISSASGRCGTDVLVSLMYGLVHRRFTGIFSIKVDDNHKSLYFQNGELVFARSDLMDDRLGEVIYRGGRITIDQMTNAAVEVTRERKFGKVLLESKEYNSADLWDFLKLQIKEIFQSVFLTSHVVYEIRADSSQPPVSIILEESTKTLIEQCASFSQMFRGFRSRVGARSRLIVREEDRDHKHEEGTHLYDMLLLIRENPTVANLLAKSKLTESNTYLNLFHLVVERYIEVEELDENSQVFIASDHQQRELKGYIDAYHIVLRTSVKAFGDAKVTFPYLDLQSFVRRLYQDRNTPIYLKSDGSIAVESVRHLYEKGRDSATQQQSIAWALQGLIQFVLQITGDLLPKNGWAVKKSIQEMLI
ncbi:DUF4388 domain-containing protein [Pseudobacteriovorax antillogorgiicola]|uniref:PatA-like N-terminal domain-containing protein n=1 Tax=Pseudobacteriovorax antillogorgiicola TaxID=1513793 RepID=A0A1Y6B3D1_9BACT|nr:DUF4388 domain-containing protein [Pseudobacteriovorax antillogorgiicola]TCS59482.1 hypothetical protein EDD56_101396 [Pseudobacteriovorax antillogorgiicola]SME87997.1 hypothetical protein SAMN06296036_10189 [Pseudobacteriovorax antillogorgiicola]